MSDKNFKVKNGIDSTGPVTITTPNTSTTGLIINVPGGGKSISFLRDGIERASIDDWGTFSTNGINIVQPWWVRSPGIDTQSFFWVGSGSRSSVGIAGTNSGTNPVVYISQNGTATNDLTQWIKPDNTILAKIDYLGNITANDLTLAGNLTVNGTTTNLNSTNLVVEDKNIIIADVATPTDTTADGAGITIKGATDKTFNWVNSTKSFTTSDPLIVDGTNSTTIPLLVKVPTNQTTNAFEVRDGQGYSMFKVIAPAGGTAYNNGSIWIRPWGTGNVGAMGTDSYQGFSFVSPAGGNISFGTGGGGKAFEINVNDTFNRYRVEGKGTGVAPIFTTAGNDTDVNMHIYPKGAGKIGINTTSPTGYVHAISSSSSTVGLIVEGASGQTSTNIFEVQRAGGGDASFGVSHNYIDLNRNTTAAASMTIYGPNASAVPLYVKGRSSQTGDLTNWLDSNSNILSSIKSNGSFYVTGNSNTTWISGPSTSGTNQIVSNGNDLAFSPFFDGLFAPANSSGRWRPVNDATSDLGTSGQRWKDLYATASVLTNNSASKVGLIVKGAASQTANLQEWQNSSGTALSYITKDGTLDLRNTSATAFTNSNSGNVGPKIDLWGGQYGIGIAVGRMSFFTPASGGIALKQDSYSGTSVFDVAYNGATLIGLQSASAIGLVIKAAASQTANLQEWQNSVGTVLAYINSSGDAKLGAVALGNGVIYGSSSWLNIATTSASQIGAIVKGAASQTGDLQQWQDSSGNVLATLKASGTLVIGGTNSVNSIFGMTLVNKSLTTYYTGNNTSYQTSLNFTRGNTTGTWMNMGTVGDAANGVASIDIRDGGNTQLFSVGYTGNTSIKLQSTSSIGLIVKAYGTQTANLFEVQDSNGLVAAKVAGDYSISSIAGGFFGTITGNGQVSGTNYLAVRGWNAAHIPFAVKGYTGQTADLTRWVNDSGTIIASVDANGNISDASNTKWLSPIGSGSDDAPTIQALIDAGKKEIRLGSGQWTFSTRIKVPNGVTLRGIGSSTTSTTGTRVNAVALIASEGTVRDIMFTGAGENAQSELGGGGIAVLGGRVINCSVNDSRWVLAPTRQPHGYLKNFMSKMQGGYGSVKVAILGDSLSENTSTTSWYGYLFNSSTAATGYYLGSYFGHPISPSEVDNMAIGGQGAYLLSAQLAMTKETLRTGGYVNQVLDGDRVSSSPFFNRNYNLAIIAIGQNGGEDWKAHLEYVVKTIRDKGIDVILLTQNPAAGNPTSRAGDEYYYRSLAETYGCLLVDTQAYYRLEVEFGRALGTTADLFGDSIHQSTQGHQLYAKAILNGILDYDSTIAVPASNTVSTRSYYPAQTDRATALAGLNTYYLVKKPDPLRDISGVTYTTATDTSIRNPIYGRGTTTNSVATIASGGYAMWGVEYATAAYIIYRENATANTLTVALQGGGSTLATLTTGVTNGRTSVQKVMLAGGYPSNRSIRITNTSGNAIQIYGVVFETHADVAFNRNTDGSYPGLTLSGTWASGYFLDMASYGGLPTPYTSTANDYATFKFYGDGLRFTTSYGKNSGIIQVKIDDTTYTAVDTYNNISEYGTYTHFYGGLDYGLHTATITLTGANASVTNNLGDGARFGLHRISAVRSSWYLTQDQQFAPNSDISAKVNSLASPTIGSTGGANIATFYNGTSGYGAGYINASGTFNINGANMGFPYTSTGATLNVNAGASSIIPVTVKGVSGQTANLQNWYAGDGTLGTRIGPYGELVGHNQLANGIGGYIGGVMWSVISGNSGYIPIVVKGAASQTANLQEWQDSAGTVLAKVTSSGSFTSYNTNFFGRTFFLQDGSTNASTQASGAYFAASSANSAIYARTTSASIVPLVVQGTTSQTADLQQWQDSTGNKLAKIIPNGSLVFGNGSSGAGFTTIHFDQVTNSINTPDGITWNFVTTNSRSAQILAVRTAASYATDLYFATANPADQYASEKMRIGSTGTVTINGFTSSNVGLIIKAAASQTANLQEWQNSAGTILTRIASDGSIYRGATTIDSYGAIYTTETMAIGANAGQRFATGGMTIINREQASAVIFGVKGIASQTGDLTQWRNSSDTILAKVDANGNFSAITKSFDIPHPTKENMRLRYSSLEGPENGVYIRGTVESNIIELPDYWTGLVHENSITVSLTAVGSAQNIYVEKIENNKVYIGGELTKAFFTVYGERKDIDKLTVEY